MEGGIVFLSTSLVDDLVSHERRAQWKVTASGDADIEPDRAGFRFMGLSESRRGPPPPPPFPGPVTVKVRPSVP